mmetsp:Transcript_31185/g.56593  ORF Transcript_31185/g.56593 Transcript_31185/m.56593 type:complete len:448 (+) Transcript_31185:141-1484(+)|eukprot:CAMPEP_0201938534 /NCGR_PEP_ID=MMETSP0903-20130614/41518_1 /ASSEMBLY_ACC=CAM_ASM_000552 /TAXON_ID=420261 /ORGANISM="Thalassiosira antarctica, Strain CCMP982" /LENGTH=447 /DNA_ID=CAMNT_0048479809 /DNA_START=88 /DNA_END=1431 /DNA_ORIENTATION=-
MSAATPIPPQSCQVILTLAHLLQQHSQSYDDEKNILLDASVKCATKMANQQNHPSQGEGAVMMMMEEGEVHMVLTGSPRPTFAETNAWLLEGQQPQHAAPTTPGRKTNDNTNDANNPPGILRGSYSICDNNVTAVETSEDASMGDADNNESGEGDDDGPTDGAQLLQEYIAECTHNSSTRNANMDDLGGSPTRTGGSVLQQFRERKYSHGDASAGGIPTKNNTTINDATNTNDTTDSNDSGYKGPMVGHAVVNAISQAQGAGLHSSRAQLLQGTIDRPDWDQRRWTDGECLFSELIDRCGLDSFEKIGAGSGADAAAGSVRPLSEKTTNLLAHLITVPASTPSQGSTTATAAIGGDEVPPGMEEDVMEEIARGILRCLRRKHSPPASKVYLVLPPMSGGSEEMNRERREMASARLAAAWQKLERYNDMIGAPKLMADAKLEFVDVSV